MMKIIAASGAIGAGKDTVMDKLKVVLSLDKEMSKGKSVIRTRFADSLNLCVSSILGVGVEELQNRELKEKKRFTFGKNQNSKIIEWSSRDVQKHFGKFFRDTLGEDVFIRAVENRFKAMSDTVLILSDLRYPNELEWVRQNGGVVVYIHNEKAVRSQIGNETYFGVPTIDKVYNEHCPPESELLNWHFYNRIETPDYWLDNNYFEDEKPFNDFVAFINDYLDK